MKKNDSTKYKPLQRLELKFKALINHDKDFLLISRDFIEHTLKDLYYLRTFHKELSSKEESFQSLQSDMQILQTRLQNQESILKTLDMAYMDKMNDLKSEITDLKESKSQLELDFTAKIQTIEFENHKLREEVVDLTNTLTQKTIENMSFDRKLMEKKLNDLENLKEYKPVDPNALKIQWIDMQMEEKLKLILQSPVGSKIFVFLKPKDVFSLSLLNKSIFQWFSFNGIQYLYALKFSDRAWDLKIKELKNKLNYFQRVSDKVPEEFLKSGIIRFICQKEKLGDYMTPILHEAQKLAFLQQEEENEKMKNPKIIKNTVKVEKITNSMLENMNQIIAKLFPNMGTFIKGELFQNVVLESKEMVTRAFDKAQEITLNMKVKYPEFSQAFCKSFAKLLVFGALLLQDAKVLLILVLLYNRFFRKQVENLKDFMIGSFQQSLLDFEGLYGRFDDLKEELKAEKIVENCDFIKF